MNAIELAIVRVARQYEQKFREGRVSDEELRQGKRVWQWREAILRKIEQRRNHQ